MQYGHFDDDAREYVITRPDTPRSWTNYLGSTEYGAIITNNAGGYSFFRKTTQGRFVRLMFNSVPMDQPGRYFYLHDHEDGDYWSSSWQPVGKSLDEYKSECRHGTAYTKIDSEYKGIKTETCYFVPLGERFEYWTMKVTNTSDRERKISAFTYVEFTTDRNIHQDLHNLQYTQYIARCTYQGDGMLRMASNDNSGVPQRNGCWLALKGQEVSGYDCDREVVVGPYNTYANPAVVQAGKCTDTQCYGDNPCGTMQTTLTLKPGETKEMVVMLGIGWAEDEGKETVEKFGSYAKAMEELEKLKETWHNRLGAIQVKTPDENFDHMINVWNAYNSLITFAWSRSASLVYSGERDGLGYRDTVQDILGVIPNITEMARERLELMISGQDSKGGAMPLVKPFEHNPGSEPLTEETEYRADDCLWLFNTVPAYVAETGDKEFYNKVIPFADSGEGTVFEHLVRAVKFNLSYVGAHGLPCGLKADWNDCLVLGFKGESLFLTFQLRLGLAELVRIGKELGKELGKDEEAAWAAAELEKFDKTIADQCWDGDWYVRAFRESGGVIGAKSEEEGKIYLNPQSWSVYSGHATGERAIKAMDSVKEYLATDYGIALCEPPYVKTPMVEIRSVLFNPSTKENGGIFCHPQGWAVIAEAILGRGDRAWEYYKAYMPAAYNDKAEIREIEPYVHAQSTHAKHSPKHGASRCPWLSGTASWSYFSAVNYLLGVRPEVEGLRIDPCISSEWDGFKFRRNFRGQWVNIEVKNPNGNCKGVSSITVNGEKVEGNLLPIDKITDECQVVAIID